MTSIAVDPQAPERTVAAPRGAGLLARLWRGLHAVQEHRAQRVIRAHAGLVADAHAYGAAPWPLDETPARATPDRTWNAVLAGTTCEAGVRAGR
jgi:hypothetical protein